MAYPVFDLHCDTADRIGWATLDLDLRFTAGTDGYFPGDETHPQDFDLIEGNACAISLAKIGNTPWAQCFATFVPDEIPYAHAARFQAQIMAHMSGQAMLNHDRMVNVRSAADIRPALKDGKVACIAAASILAKVTRDHIMEAYALRYPAYGFESNKGYGSAAHIAAIREHGPCPLHRMSFLSKILAG